MSGTLRDDLAALVSEAAAHVEWARAIGGDSVPEVVPAGGRAAVLAPGRASPPGAGTAARGIAEPPGSEALPRTGEKPGDALLRQLRGGPDAPPPRSPGSADAPPAAPRGNVAGAAAASPGSAATALTAPPASLSAAPSPTAPSLPVEERVRRLTLAANEVAACTRCRLAEGRTNTVFSRGWPAAPVVFVGEGPGHQEDLAGQPFVGPAGQLLDKMIGAMGLAEGEFYICNVVKCRPPENRNPLPDEVAACAPYLRTQLEVVAPRIIVALGRVAAENLGCALPGRTWRGIWGGFEGIPVMPTYHPAFLLRSPEMKRPVWEDLQKVMQRLGRASAP